jgi:gluconolactonase
MARASRALEIDEPCFTTAGWKGGWSGVKPRPPGFPRPPAIPLVQRLPADTILTDLGERAGGFRGGTGETHRMAGYPSDVVQESKSRQRSTAGELLARLRALRAAARGADDTARLSAATHWADRKSTTMNSRFLPEPGTLVFLLAVALAPLCAPAASAPAPALPARPPAGIVTGAAAPMILGVVSAGTPVELLADGFETVEGPLPQLDDGLLFTNSRLNRVLRLAPDGKLTVWFEGAGAANALTRTPAGDIVATMTEARTISVLQPGQPARPLVGDFEGTQFNRPNDLVADSRGNIYFTDTASTTPGGTTLPAAVYQITRRGKLVRIVTGVERPNGVALSPDERTLYVANTAGEWVIAVALDRNGEARKARNFARLIMPPPPPAGTTAVAGSGADGMAVDEKGRLYVATAVGVQVFSDGGEPMGTIVLPKQPQNLAFSGPGRYSLFVLGRGSIYRIQMLTRGPQRTGK